MKKVILIALGCFALVSCEKNYKYCVTCNEINHPAWVTGYDKLCDIDKKAAELGKKNKEAGIQVTDGPENKTRTAYYTCEISVYK